MWTDTFLVLDQITTGTDIDQPATARHRPPEGTATDMMTVIEPDRAHRRHMAAVAVEGTAAQVLGE